jgi:hypothetical protein
MLRFSFAFLATALFLAGCSRPLKTVDRGLGENSSIVRVNATCQIYDPLRPWLKRPPYSRRAIGTLLSETQVLVTAEMVANANYIELEKPGGNARCPATVACIDYEANLALLTPDQPGFLKGSRTLSLETDATNGDGVEIWQLEDNDALARTSGIINTVEAGYYPERLGRYLVYRLSLSLQLRDNTATLPLVRNGELAGLLFHFDARTQNATAIAAPVIEHFLKDAADGAYEGFPRLGMGFSTLRDPQLQTYVKAPPGDTGVYVSKVLQDSPGAVAGIQEGDVLAAVNGLTIDQDGNYEDSLHGRISLEHLINGKHYVGEELALRIYRNGEPLEKKIVLGRKQPEDFVSPPYTYDEAPRYLVHGGFVFVELSRTLLKSFGKDWYASAPQKLVYQDAFQDDLYPGENRRIILISQVLPTDGTIGYENLAGSIVAKVNGVEVKSLNDINQGLGRGSGMVDEIELADDPFKVYLDPLKVAEEAPKLQKFYGIQELERLK